MYDEVTNILVIVVYLACFIADSDIFPKYLGILSYLFKYIFLTYRVR